MGQPRRTETKSENRTTRASLICQHEAEIATLEADFAERRHALKRSCTDAVAQAARERDVARGRIQAERLQAGARARNAHDARVKSSAEALAIDLKSIDRVSEKALKTERDRYEEVSSAQSVVLREESAVLLSDEADKLSAIRVRHAAELEIFDAEERERASTSSD